MFVIRTDVDINNSNVRYKKNPLLFIDINNSNNRYPFLFMDTNDNNSNNDIQLLFFYLSVVKEEKSF